MDEDKKIRKTGTTTVGILCKDGIVLAADKRATAGIVVNKRERKIHQIADNMAVTMAGLVSDAQLLIKLGKAEIKLKDIQSGRPTTVPEAAHLIAGMLYQNIRRMSMVQGIVGFLLGGKDDTGFHLYDLGIDGSVSKADDYVSDGSGSVFALGVLEAQYRKGLDVEEGVKLAITSISAAMQRDTASGNGIDVLTITESGVRFVFSKDLNTRIEA